MSLVTRVSIAFLVVPGGLDNLLSRSRSDKRRSHGLRNTPLAAAPPGQQVVQATRRSSRSRDLWVRHSSAWERGAGE